MWGKKLAIWGVMRGRGQKTGDMGLYGGKALAKWGVIGGQKN
jgi:hypothetical protein